MTAHAHGGVLVVLVAFALGVGAGNLVLTLARLVPGRVRRHLTERLAPGALSGLACAALALPVVVGALMLVATLMIPTLALFAPELDHCTAYLTAPHVCFSHGTLAFSSGWEALGVITLAGGSLLALGGEGLGFWRARRVACALLDGSQALGRVCWTNDETPFAFTVGLVRPQVVVSEGLKRVLSAAQLEAALAHEGAHATRRHALVRAGMRVVACAVLPPLRRPLLELLVLGQELAADDEAAAHVGSRTLVAETLLACVRSSRTVVSPASAPALVGPALIGPALAQRVEALCDDPRRGRAAPWLAAALATLALTLIAARGPVHTAAEVVAGTLLSMPVHSHPSSHDHASR